MGRGGVGGGCCCAETLGAPRTGGCGCGGDTGAPPTPRGWPDSGVGHPGYALPSPCRLEGPVGVRGCSESPRGLGNLWGCWGSPGVLCAPLFGVPCGHGAPCVPQPGLGILWMFGLLNTLCPPPGWRSHVRPPDSQCLPSAGGSQGLLRASPAKTGVPFGLGESLPLSASL